MNFERYIFYTYKTIEANKNCLEWIKITAEIRIVFKYFLQYFSEKEI